MYTGFQTANGQKQVTVSLSNFAAAAVIKAGADLFPRGDSHKLHGKWVELGNSPRPYNEKENLLNSGGPLRAQTVPSNSTFL